MKRDSLKLTPPSFARMAGIAGLLLVSGLPARAAGGLLFGATSLEARNNLNSVSAVSSSDNSRLASRQVLLINRDPHALMHRVGGILAQWLETSPLIERTEHLPAPAQTRGAAASLPIGARGPDLFLRLEAERLNESGWISRNTEAMLMASIGDAPWQSSHSIVDDTTPPLIQWHWSGRLEHQSTLTGFEKVKYRKVADGLAGEFAKAITNHLAKLREDHGALPELPAYFYGPYEPAPDLPFLNKAKAKLEFSYYGLLTHNQTFWRFLAASNPVPQLEQIIQQLKADEWRVDTIQITNTPSLFIRAARGDTRLEIFNPREAGLRGGPNQRQDLLPIEFVVHYRQPFSREERQDACDRLLAEAAPVETLLLFERSFSAAQRERFHAVLTEKPVASPTAYLSLARMHLERRQTNQAIQDLTRAKALAATLRNPSSVETQIGNVAKQISPKEELLLPVTAETLRALEFIGITNAPQSLALEKLVQDPLFLFSVPPDGQPRIFCLRLESLANEGLTTAYAWTATQTHPHGRSTSSSHFELTDPGWNQTFTLEDREITIRIRPAGQPDRLEYHLQVKDLSPAPR